MRDAWVVQWLSIYLPLTQGVILESQDTVPHWPSCMEPASPSAYVSAPLSLTVTIINELKKKYRAQDYVSPVFKNDRF